MSLEDISDERLTNLMNSSDDQIAPFTRPQITEEWKRRHARDKSEAVDKARYETLLEERACMKKMIPRSCQWSAWVFPIG